MARNSLYPGFIKLRYTGNGHVHYQTIPVRPFLSVGGTWFVVLKGNAAGELWTDFVDAYWNVLKPFLNTADELQVAHLWHYDSEDGDPIFREEYAVAAAGTAAGAALPYGQQVFTMRTELGGLFRCYIMECSTVANVKAYPPFGTGATKNLTDFLKGSTSAVVGRDGAFLSSVVSQVTKYNDALRKKYLLQQ